MGQYYSSQQAEYASQTLHSDPQPSKPGEGVSPVKASFPQSEQSNASTPTVVTPEKEPSPKTPRAATPKASPKPVTPKPSTPKVATPKPAKAATPKAATPKSASPDVSTPKPSTPKASKPATPKTLKSEEDEKTARAENVVKGEELEEKEDEDDAAGEAVLRVEVPLDLSQCKLAELRELAAENALKTSGSKYELIGRLLRLFPATKLTEEALSGFKVLDLKSMAKGCDLPQVGSKGQLIASLIAQSLLPVDSAAPKKRVAAPAVAATPRAAKTPQPKRKRDEDASEPKAPLTERKAKRARSGSATKR